MNSILKLTLITALLACISLPFTANAQDKRYHQLMHKTTPAERATALTDVMMEILDLSQLQTKAIQDINLKYAKEHQRLFKAEQSKESRKQEMKAFRKEKDDEIRYVLNDPQYALFLMKRKELMGYMKMKHKQKKKNKNGQQ